MIDQTKDKKDDALAAKLEAAKKSDPEKAQKLAQIEKEKAELQKAQKGGEKLKEQAGNNTAKAMQPIGSARVINDKAEVHSEPGKKGSLIGEMSAQRQIDVLGMEGNEIKVLVDGKVGYIAANMTDYAGAGKAEEKKVPQPIGSAKVAVSALRVRTAPGKGENYIGTLRQADNVNVYGEKDGYLEIHVGDQIGYISAEHTDYAGAQKGKEIQPKDGKALDQAPAELQELLAKESLTAPEIANARTMIEQCPESIRGDLYETLQTKAQASAKKDQAKPGAGEEFEGLATSLELLGVQNPETDKTFAAYLAQLKNTQKLSANGGMNNWGSIVNAMGVSYQAMMMPGDHQAAEKKFWSEMARAQLRDGHAVMTCIDGQAVRVEAIDDDGLVLTAPDQVQLAKTQNYSGKAEQKGKGKRAHLAFDRLNDVNIDWVISLG